MSLAEQLLTAQRELFAKMEEDRTRYQALVGLSIRLGSISSNAKDYDQSIASVQEDFEKIRG